MFRSRLGIIFQLSALVFFLFPSYAASLDLSLHGFLQGAYAVNLAGQNPSGGDFKWAEERAQLRLEAVRGPLRLYLKTDGLVEHVDSKADIELREGYLDFSSDKWDLRAGRQVVTWGLGDLVFINDVFPKDYEAFFSGRPLEYLKKGVDAVKVGFYPGPVSVELFFIPVFEPNTFPDSRRFHMYDPMAGIPREELRPEKGMDSAEYALRLYRDIAGFDASLYFYHGFSRQPAGRPDDPSMPARLSLVYPELSVYGASMQGRAIGGVLSLEAGYYDSRQDRSGSDPMLPNSQSRFLIGFQRQFWEDFTLGLQYYGEYMHRYHEYAESLPPGFPRERRLRDLLSLRLTQFLRNQTLRLSFFSFWSLSDGDFLLNPEVKYHFSDHVWAALGANLFGGGEKWSQFGQLDRNDNLYMQVRYEF